MNKIILASQSPRRKQLLEWAEIPFEIIVKETSEDYPPGLEPEEIAVYIAQQKAAAVQKLPQPVKQYLLLIRSLFLAKILLVNRYIVKKQLASCLLYQEKNIK
jgi:predicted house-cleaning NTP pyrophosphatase (Maf/HAM1 superfamily)